MTRIVFDSNVLGFKVGSTEDVDDGLAQTLVNAEAAHLAQKKKKPQEGSAGSGVEG